MGKMLLRTRKIGLVFRVTCICVVSFTYLFVALVANNAKGGFSNEPVLGNTYRSSRHLLALSKDVLPRNKTATVPPDFKVQNSSSGASQNVTSLDNSTSQANEQNCTPPAIEEFPSDGLTREQRKHGWVLIHLFIACYLFIFLAVVCDDYFVPCIKKLCDVLHLKEDVAGATFMAIASSSAEIFINSIGTFITQGDLGVGTIVGSAVFNILAVPACCGFFANMVLDLEWYPLTRDSVVYGMSVILLIVFLQDGKIFYYEALCLVLLYTIYVLVMVFNDSLRSCFHKIVTKFRRRRFYKEIISENQPLLVQSNGKVNNNYSSGVHDILASDLTLKDIEELEESTNIWEWPTEDTKKAKCWWTFTWPISFILYMTTPTMKNHPKMFAVTFIMCIFWIGSVSYVVAWLITIIGDTLEIPDSVMGLTFLAAGTSVPEAVSSVLVTNQGHGAMGISSSIGSNTFDILLCLGLPWFIKSAFYPKVAGEYWITINSQGINYSCACLLTTLILVYSSFCFNRFKLDWKIGLSCLMMYVGFLVFATLVELNVFFPVNLPTCGR
ncbi:sodium/potassium/calcium exchanger 3-like [Anthonomus grandis grandis]|uniref:sodium/potassium/calcium exchanger 3-like n=1 Tax=Anthonomus grandis grandis TaxID=2921223 RepID=UPI002166701D|nr:sodium/potassium/calcium exchanger 3-like [Anthonomus grandis grandis]